MAGRNSNQKDLFGDQLDCVRTSSADWSHWLNQGPKHKVRVGDIVKGTILSQTKDEVLVDIGTGVDALLAKRDFVSFFKDQPIRVGEVIEAIVQAVKGEQVFLKLKGSKIFHDEQGILDDVYDKELAVEGLVTEIIKGGFRVLLPGAIRAFCPQAQMDFILQNPENYLNKKYDFIIIQKEGRNIIVSRRRALEQAQIEKEIQFLEQVQAQELLKAQVIRVERFGAFVLLKDWGLEGLIPISELSWVRIRDPHDIVQPGQELDVVYLGSKEDERGKLRISLSLKQATPDPWGQVQTKLYVGQMVTGIVQKKEAFGYFVELLPGIVGLLPHSAYRDSAQAHSFEHLKKGDKVQVKIHDVRVQDKKISLTLADQTIDGESIDASAYLSEQKSLGTLGDLLKKTLQKKS